MRFTVQRRLAADIMGCSPKRVHFKEEALEDIREAITKLDIRGLIKRGAITEKAATGTSRYNSRRQKLQRSKGRRRGVGSRKGKSTARLQPKKSWMDRVRAQRNLLASMRERGLLDTRGYRQVYLKIKGGFFRNQRHIKLYVAENGLLKK